MCIHTTEIVVLLQFTLIFGGVKLRIRRRETIMFDGQIAPHMPESMPESTAS